MKINSGKSFSDEQQEETPFLPGILRMPKFLNNCAASLAVALDHEHPSLSQP